MNRGQSWYLRLMLTLGALAAVVWSQDDWHNHPELEWQSFETEHFLIHFHQGTERSAREAAAVAEKIYGPVTRIYDFEPPAKTQLIIKDVDDVSNGLAYYYDNKIEIWARPLDFDLRGSHRWMQDVITHEFVHIIQLATTMKFTRRIPGLYFQVLGYEDEKREDVLYGYPNVLASYPYPGVNIPPWFAEGVAQLMYPGANYDYWDSHRNMILRDRVINGRLLSFAAMNSFGKRGVGNESVYNQGFAFVRYLTDRYGMEVLEAISRIMAGPLTISIGRAMERVTGTPGQQLYREWEAELESQYSQALANVREHQVTGEILLSEGSANLHPVWHPSERKFAFLSNQRSDFFGQTDLYIYDFDSGKSQHVAILVQSAPCWSADGRTLYYAGRSKPGKTGARWLELYAYDLDRRRKKQLTRGERVTSPVLVGSGRAIAFLTVRDGTSNIRLMDLATREITTLSVFEGGEYIHSLTYDPGDNLLIFDVTFNHGRQLLQLQLADGQIVTCHFSDPDFAAQADTRDPVVTESGLLLATDASGVFNLYLSGEDGKQGYVTNVIGGAFMPSVNSQGEVLYSIYRDDGYKIAYQENPPLLEEDLVGIPPEKRGLRPSSPREGPDMALSSQRYEEIMSPLFIMPRLIMDYGTIKPGLYFYANDVLDRLQIFGGASVNALKDTDYFLLFEFRKFRPTLYAEIFAVNRNISQDFKYYDYDGTNDFRFNLLEGLVGGRMPLGWHRFWLELNHSRYRMNISQAIEGVEGGGFGFDYYIGTAATARWQYYARRPEYGGNMFPTTGYEVGAEVRGEYNGLVDSLAISEHGTIVPVFEANNTFRLIVNFKKYMALYRPKRISMAYESTVGWLSNQDVDDFFYFFGGGPPGLRGYTYYDSTVQGTNLMVHTLTLRLPIFLERNIPFWHVILQNASVGFVAQYGDGFQGSWLGHRYKSSVGVEARLSGYSFYVFPFALAYEVHRPLGSDFKGYRHYVSLLFDFNP